MRDWRPEECLHDRKDYFVSLEEACPHWLPARSSRSLLEPVVLEMPQHIRRRVSRRFSWSWEAMDPCTFRLFHEGILRGIVIVEVDAVFWRRLSLRKNRGFFNRSSSLESSST